MASIKAQREQYGPARAGSQDGASSNPQGKAKANPAPFFYPSPHSARPRSNSLPPSLSRARRPLRAPRSQDASQYHPTQASPPAPAHSVRGGADWLGQSPGGGWNNCSLQTAS